LIRAEGKRQIAIEHFLFDSCWYSFVWLRHLAKGCS